MDHNNCNKVKFFDKVDALLALYTIEHKNRRNKKIKENFNRREIRVYFCELCKCWHLTSKR